MQIFKSSIVSLLIASLCLTPHSLATTYDALPNIGTAAASTLSINQEIEFGQAYLQMLRASQPIAHDPLITEYLNALGANLLTHADDVKTPFRFFLIENKTLNAFAFFGGHIAIHSGLFLYTQNESELASVLAHEIAHLTQRHLARAMEDRARQTPLTIAAMVGSLMLGIASPQAGIAAAQATTAARAQASINYTRDNEKEADRIGVETLNRAGFDVHSMPKFFSRLSDQYRFTNKPPPFLLTHPLPEDRITDSRHRAEQYKKQEHTSSFSFELTKARVIARHLGFSKKHAQAWFDHALTRTPSKQQKMAYQYGKALVNIDNKHYKNARQLLEPILKKHPENRFLLDAMTDLDLGEKHFKSAITRLEKALLTQPNNPILRINLNYAFVKAKKYPQAISGLLKYTHEYPDDVNAWALLHEAYEKTGNAHGALAAEGEIFALKGHWQKAIQNFNQASQIVKLGSLDQARYDARIDQLRAQQSRSMALKR